MFDFEKPFKQYEELVERVKEYRFAVVCSQN